MDLKGFYKHRKKIIIAVLAVSIVTIILGLGLGLGIQLEDCRKKVISESCRGRCHEPYDNEALGCHCHLQCNATNSCCYDFHDICYQPTQQWECTRLRCGEKRLAESKCHCSDDCLSARDCCTNYKSVCEGDTQWVEDECVDMVGDECPAGFKKQPMLLISLDGLRAEYFQTWSSLIPVMDKIRRCGTSVPHMQAVFPSKTFPNHYTIATGLYSESHGLVDNNMYDPEFDAYFSLSNSEKDNPRWYHGQPIWHTAKYQGLTAGTFFWPGSDVEINGSFPNIYEKYDGYSMSKLTHTVHLKMVYMDFWIQFLCFHCRTVPFEMRVFTVLKWLMLPDDQRPDFYTLYLEEPDKSGHSYGPVSGGLVSSLQGVDKIIGQLMNGLKQLNLQNCINIIIVSDHGMEETSCDRKEALQNLVGDTSHLEVNQGTFGRIRPKNKEQPFDEVRLIANMTCKKPDQKIRPYLKAHLPKRLHYANSRRIENVTVLVSPKWLFERCPGCLTFCSGGDHGYDNDIYSMQSVFLGYGPKFHFRTQVDPFSNVELYNLMCDILEISPAQNNGTHGSLNHLLKTPYYNPQHPEEKVPPGQCPLLSLNPSDTLACNCTALGDFNPNTHLNLSESEVSAIERKHMPFGKPRVLKLKDDYCLLHQEGFVSAYSKDLFMPMWNSYSLDKPENPDPLPAIIEDCLRADVRILANQSQRCDQYAATNSISYAFLYPPSLNKTAEEQYDALTMTNVVPMLPQFRRIWDYFQAVLLKKYAMQYNGINVVTGPVFDYNYDGLYDTVEQIQQHVPGTNIPVPTHYFMVLTSCKNISVPMSLCYQELQTVSFIVPHRADNSETCNSSESESQWVEDLLWFHQSRVRDVEWITGLDFFQDSIRPVAELLRVKSRPTAAIHRMP
ncbi:venom phosphodiesterase 1-like isoform X1 [Denticeps clupeoides]|uniref:venom phosphodiesterase 1-like isoform X1 n=2 Tax=Denticeps clupeoides TaxID=299321 RepID=UPI0010A497BA|nr:venom phosphodiesterase 1-like isoform X1 [Denticeps clupeoides]